MNTNLGVIAEGVSLSYNSRLVLGDVSLQLRKGAIVTLLGPNGCGKTTLLKIINGLLRPDSGKVYVDGNDVSRMGQTDMARLIGHVPQTQRSSFPFTALDIVLTGRMPHISALSQPGPRDLEKARQAMDMVGASHLSSRPYTQISGGERQLVMIARALAQEPSFLLLDEPTSYLDFKNQYQVLKMVSQIARDQKVTVVMTLHDPNHALMFSDEVVLLRKLAEKGCKDEQECKVKSNRNCQNVVAAGSPAEVMTPENIFEAYGIEVEFINVRKRLILLPL
ncbi:ABC transporter ATP-binding protein [Methanothrix sp.]|uniref:ABC transporter ATP-binding protein n=1 Tax=Methanothrix sp. TaxID=90426 RepID=UPI0027B22090|nr:Cobalamin import ATP-binding protein BtuD [Euryarchaeota archaeon]